MTVDTRQVNTFIVL